MSDYELNKGKLFPVEINEDIAKELINNSKHKAAYQYYESWMEMFEEYCDGLGFAKVNGKWYKIEWEIKEDCNGLDGFANVNVNENGVIDFHTYHYNGGAHWSEVVEGAIE